MIEVNGHLVDENEISYISPVNEEKSYDWHSFYFHIIIDTKFVLLEFKEKDAATEAWQKVAVVRCNVNE